MRKLLVAALIVLAGCETTTSPSDITVTASATASSFRVGESVSLLLTVTNQSDEEIQVTGFACPQKPFEVRNISQAVVGPAAPQYCSLALIAPLMIAPGESAQLQTSWSGDSANGPADEIIYVSPGTYVIRPKILVDGEIVYGNAIGMIVKQ